MGTRTEPGLSRQGAKPQHFCPEARRLLSQFGDAVQDVLTLHEQQFHAIVEEDASASRFNRLIYDANHRKQNAKYMYMTHVQEHACSSLDDEPDGV